MIHLKCTDLELGKVKNVLKGSQFVFKDWTCSRCLFSYLPLCRMRSIDQQNEGINQHKSMVTDTINLTDTFNEHLEALAQISLN